MVFNEFTAMMQATCLPLSKEIEKLCEENYSLQNEMEHIRNAKDAGYEIVKNNSQQLTFDLDGEEALEIFKSRVGVLERKGLSPFVVISKSKSGNYHAVVGLGGGQNISEALAIAIQACLGSDWKREMLGVLRQLNGQENQVSLLFRPKDLEIIQWP